MEKSLIERHAHGLEQQLDSTKIVEYIEDVLLTIEDEKERAYQWNNLHTIMMQYRIMISPSTWSFLLEDKVVGPLIRASLPHAEQGVMNALSLQTGVPRRYNKYKGIIEEYDEDVNIWVKVDASSKEIEAAKSQLS